MYNYLVERMYQEYETVTDQNNIHFVSNGKVVGTLYRKEQVLNISFQLLLVGYGTTTDLHFL